ncbi:hypothetical protein [Streptomyces sp. NPDC085665]|uniref:hypothetical protein n=1 Tax=Streptomyces sp. NPDC085665 TaxID=3365735 RepID=UPI0037D09FF2
MNDRQGPEAAANGTHASSPARLHEAVTACAAVGAFSIAAQRGLRRLVQASERSTCPSRRARYSTSLDDTAARRCAEQAREVMELVLPEFPPTDPLVDWAAVAISEFAGRALMCAALGKITCELRVDGEHLYVAVEWPDPIAHVSSRGLVDLISAEAGSYVTDKGTQVLWAAAEIVPAGSSAA